MRNFFALAIATAFSLSAFSATLEDAQQAWSQRSWTPEGISAAQRAADIYGELATAAAGVDKGVLLTNQSEATYFAGEAVADVATKISFHEAGFTEAEQAQGYLTYGDANWARAKYFWGANKGKWGLAKGPGSVIMEKPKLEQAMNEIMDAGQEAVEDFGPHRILGKLYGVLPGILGGDKVLAVYHLSYALENSRNELDEPTHGLNVNYIGEIFPDIRDSKFDAGMDKAISRARNMAETAATDELKAKFSAAADRLEAARANGALVYAKTSLEEFVTAASDTSREGALNPKRIAETVKELEDSKALLRKLQ